MYHKILWNTKHFTFLSQKYKEIEILKIIFKINFFYLFLKTSLKKNSRKKKEKNPYSKSKLIYWLKLRIL